MSLILKTVVVITVYLSNGGMVKYEVDTDIAAKQTVVLNEKDEHFSLIEIFIEGDSCKCEMAVTSDNCEIKRLRLYKDDTFIAALMDSEFEVECITDHSVHVYHMKVHFGLNVVHYYLNLKEFTTPESLNYAFSLINKNQLHIWSDSYWDHPDSVARPVKIVISERPNFSQQVQNLVERIAAESKNKHKAK